MMGLILFLLFMIFLLILLGKGVGNSSKQSYKQSMDNYLKTSISEESKNLIRKRTPSNGINVGEVKANLNDTVCLKNLNSYEIETYLLQEPQIENRAHFLNVYNRSYYHCVKRYDGKLEDNILYTDSPLGKEVLGKSEGEYIELKITQNTIHYKIIEIKR
jgi:transcription elongation GreA/GreB family factor